MNVLQSLSGTRIPIQQTLSPRTYRQEFPCAPPSSPSTLRSNIKVHDRKVQKARAKQNAELAKRLLELKPSYRLDHLVKER